MKPPRRTVAATTFALALSAVAGAAAAEEAVISSAPIFESAPFAECHASTLEETADGALVAAWFGGTEEGHPDVEIWSARRSTAGAAWSEPLRVASGRGADGEPQPTWNPVLFQPAADGDRAAPLLLFYKVGPSPSAWWGMLRRSRDGGRTWSEPERLPDGVLGPIRSRPIELGDGALLCGSSTEHDGWRVHFETTPDLGRTWRRITDIDHRRPDGGLYDAIQPTLLRRADGSLLALTRSRQDAVLATTSRDGGESWSPLVDTGLPNPSAGVEGVTLADGRLLLIYNPTRRGPGSRSRLAVAVSEDGETWRTVAELENQPGEYSYPAAIQTRDGKVQVTYTWRRQRIQHVVLDPERFAPPPATGRARPDGG